MITQGKSYAGTVSCDELPLLEHDRLRLGLEEVVDIHLEAGEEEDAMNVTLFISDDLPISHNAWLKLMIRQWNHKFNVVTA